MYYKVSVYAKVLDRNHYKFAGEYLVECSERKLQAFKRNWSQGKFIVETISGVE